ncbi:mycothiol transferase [Nocardioides flavescens]|uniref:DUF664 domain-containing protein n=1 Tax=Nocardioides flavescens TaxID=2691959 RepID=A0A6L7EX16_9ACTN|nr:DUF664 domain-containing protein [Nocardioides flavescens]
MTPSELLSDAFDRIQQTASAAVDGLSEEQLTERPGPEANTIAWLVWHLTRVQDDHVADVAGTEQVWTSGGYAERWGLPFDDTETGFDMDPDQVGRVRASASALTDYLTAVTEATKRYLETLGPDDLDRVVDENWDPPVTLGARLVSVIGDDLQHAGQAAYARGLLGA